MTPMGEAAKPLVICLFGPTAAGKTDIAIALHDKLPVDIVSVDSAMVYRRMNIGTAKPDAATLARAPHRLIDIRDPWDTYNAGDFCADVERDVADIVARGRVPLLAGGTMMYFHALQNGLAKLPEGSRELRAELDQRASQSGWPALHAELRELDPDAAARIEPQDAQRIQRALEVIYLAGEKLSVLQRATAPTLDADFLNIGLMPADRASLHQRIEQRFSAMLDAGLVEEVDELLSLPQVSAESPALRAVGYRQLIEWRMGDVSEEEAIASAVVATRRLAKRQMTWMRGMPATQMFNSESATVGADVLAAVQGAVDSLA